MEQIAKSKELGIWQKSVKLISETQVKASKYQAFERVTVEMVNVTDGRYFHVRVIDKNAHYSKIESLMN
jgi:hypothetical protein